jgi:phosphoribosyl-ATP pyrophosphohydrolase
MNADELYSVIRSRKGQPVDKSYTAFLLAKGEDEVIKKVGEEAVEVILAAKGQGRQRLIEEVADLTYHVLVLLALNEIEPQAVRDELEQRHRKKTSPAE